MSPYNEKAAIVPIKDSWSSPYMEIPPGHEKEGNVNYPLYKHLKTKVREALLISEVTARNRIVHHQLEQNRASAKALQEQASKKSRFSFRNLKDKGKKQVIEVEQPQLDPELQRIQIGVHTHNQGLLATLYKNRDAMLNDKPTQRRAASIQKQIEYLKLADGMNAIDPVTTQGDQHLSLHALKDKANGLHQDAEDVHKSRKATLKPFP